MPDPILVPPIVGEPVVDQTVLLPEGVRAMPPGVAEQEPGFFSELGRGFGAGIQGLRSGAGSTARLAGFRSFGVGQQEAAEAALQEIGPPPSDLEGVLKEPGKAIPLSGFSSGNLLASLATQLGTGGILGAALKLATGRFGLAGLASGAAGVSLANELGETAELARQAGADPRTARVIGGGIASSALDFASLLAPAALLLGKNVGPLPLRLAAALFGAPLFESATEAAQDAVKSVAATGQVPERKALANTFFTTLLGAVPTLGVPGAAGVAIRGKAAPAAPAPQPGQTIPDLPAEESPPVEIAPARDVTGRPTIPEADIEFPLIPSTGDIQFSHPDMPFYRERPGKGVAFKQAPQIPGIPSPAGVPFPPVNVDMYAIRKTKGGLVSPVELDADGRPVVQRGPIFTPYESQALDDAVRRGALTEEDIRRAIQSEHFGDRAAVRRRAGLTMSLEEIKALPDFQQPQLKIIEESRAPRERVVARDFDELTDLRAQARSRFVEQQVNSYGLPQKKATRLKTLLNQAITEAEDPNVVPPEGKEQYLSQRFSELLKGQLPKPDQERFIEDYVVTNKFAAPEFVSDVADHPIASAVFSPRTQAISDITDVIARTGRVVDNTLVRDTVKAYLGALPKEQAKSLRGDPLFLGELKLEIQRQTGPNRVLFSKNNTAAQSLNFLQWFADSKIVNPDGTPKVVYHGTQALDGFAVFKTKFRELGSHFGTFQQANTMAALEEANKKNIGAVLERVGAGSQVSPHIIPVYLRIRNPLRLVDLGGFSEFEVAPQLFDEGIINEAQLNDFLESEGTRPESETIALLQKAIQDAGYDGVVYLNRREGDNRMFPEADKLTSMTDDQVREAFPEAQDSYIVFEDNQIKSAVGNNGNYDLNRNNILESKNGSALEPMQPGQKLVFRHWGNVPGGRTDPNKMGTGVKGRDNTDTIHGKIGVNYTSAVLDGANYTEPEVQQRTPYIGQLDPTKVFDARNLRSTVEFIEAQKEVSKAYGPDFSAAVAQFQKMLFNRGFDAVLYPNGQLRIFTPQEVWPAPTAESLKANAKTGFAGHQKTKWSATNLVSGADLRGSPGYLVHSVFGGHQLVNRSFTEQDLTSFAEKNMGHLGNPGNVLHTWFDRSEGESVASVGIVVPDLETALNHAREAGLYTVFDMRSGMEIPVSHPVFDIAHLYNRSAGLPPISAIAYEKANPTLASEIAQAYDEMPTTTIDTDVTAAYESFNNEVEAQYQFAIERGIKFEPWKSDGQPYKNSSEMRRDVFENKHLWVFIGGEPHPGMTAEQTYRFRAVHDLFGHAKTGFEFGPTGEWNATRAHAQMFTDKAVPAMLSETLGQNSWVNFGKANEGVPVARKAYAEQKMGLLPKTMRDAFLRDLDLNRVESNERLDSILVEKGQAALAYLRKIVGKPLDLSVRLDKLPAGVGGEFRPKTIDTAKALLTLAANNNDIMTNASHEGFHYIDLHMLTDAERRVIDKAFAPGTALYDKMLEVARQLDEKNGYTLDTSMVGNPYDLKSSGVLASITSNALEVRAYAFQMWRNGQLTVDAKTQSVFQRILTFLNNLLKKVTGLGFTTYEDIFNAIERGEYANYGNSRVYRGPMQVLFARSSEDYPGAPSWVKTGQDLKKLRRRLINLAVEGEKHGRFWYEDSSQAFLDLFNGSKEQAAQFAKVIATMSSRTPPATNFKHAWTAWNQWLRNEPIKAGTYPTEMGKTATDILNGTYKPDKFGREVPGPKRNNFFRNLMIKIDSNGYGSHQQNSTIDMWMAHVMGYGDIDGKISIAQYRFADEQVNVIAQRLGWPRHQVQAAIWTAIKARMDATRSTAKQWGIKKRYFIEKINDKTFVDMDGRVKPKGRKSYELKDDKSEMAFARGWMDMAMKTTIGEADLIRAGYNFKHAIQDFGKGETGSLFSKNASAPVVQEHTPFLDGEDQLFAANDMEWRKIDQGMRRGDAQHMQISHNILDAFNKADIPQPTYRQLLLPTLPNIKAKGDSITRFVEQNVLSLLKLSERSKGVANVAGVLFAHGDRKKRLIADSVEKNLSEWVDNSTQADVTAVSKALLNRTVGKFDARTGKYVPVLAGSEEFQAIRSALSDKQRKMFDQANNMIAKMLNEEFKADQVVYRNALGNGAAYQQWESQRRNQIKNLIESGYIPERRFGDFAVRGWIDTDKGPLTVFHSQHGTQQEAQQSLALLKKHLGPQFGDVKWEWITRHKAQHEGPVSYLQFADTARRLGIQLSASERERLAKFTIEADSVRRNRLFRRLNIAGYSESGERILAEFAVGISNKVAHAEFDAAINDALHGYRVDIQYTPEGAPLISTDQSVNVWKEDGHLAGHYRNIMDERVDFVLNSQHDRSDWSSRLRSLASFHFLGGSVAAMMVQLTSLPLFTVPWLFQYTGAGSAYTKVTSAFAYAAIPANFKILTDLSKLENERLYPLKAIDDVTGLRSALVQAARDGTILDTELYQIMGMARGSVYSKSKGVQKALRGWMFPFRTGEHLNRLSTFIASYKIGQELLNQGKLPTTTVFDFAKNATLRTQFRYDEANRPGLAHSNLGALLFVFRSFPLYAMEMITTLHKQNPKAAAFALFSLWMAAGTEGLPFAANILDIIDVISQRIFGSPFNARRAIRNIAKDASEAVLGVDASGLVMHGAVNYLTGMQFASRVGLGEIIPGTRFGAADADYEQVLSQVLGPVGNMVTGAARGAGALTRGEFREAVKVAAPIAARNALKGYDYWTKGYATDRAGRKLIDVSGWEAAAQGLGFSSAALAEAYDVDRIVRQDLAFYTQMRSDLMRELIGAIREGDTDTVNSLVSHLAEWNKSNPHMPMVLNGSSLRRQIMLYGLPLTQRTLQMLPKQLRQGDNLRILGME